MDLIIKDTKADFNEYFVPDEDYVFYDGKEDLHAPVGTGKVDWKCFDQWAKGLKDAPSVLIEVRGISALEKSLSYMEKENIYPFG